MSNFGLGQRQDFMQPSPTLQPPPPEPERDDVPADNVPVEHHGGVV